jgi:hypothetical protein
MLLYIQVTYLTARNMDNFNAEKFFIKYGRSNAYLIKYRIKARNTCFCELQHLSYLRTEFTSIQKDILGTNLFISLLRNGHP